MFRLALSAFLLATFMVGGSVGPTTGAIQADESHEHEPAAAVGLCGESMDAWHPPTVDGCSTGHEHGDAPPAWLTDAGYSVSFHGAFNTSAMENTHKHAGMKGFLARFNDVDIYFRVHASSNVLDRAARFHSYEVWARDPSGGVSHWQGWYDTGDPIADRIPRTQSDPGRRPIMLVVDRASWDNGVKCEQWYATTASWGWDFGWTICGINALFYPGEHLEQDRAFWKAPPDGPGVGGVRRLEAAWYGASMPGRDHPTGVFWATQFGQIVDGPEAPECTGQTVRAGQSYGNVCLEQFIAPSMSPVKFPNNAVQKDFDTAGAHAPN
ncbi:MAG: hypothetical protein IT306_11815 [Chloroflexi bacterium]|nr:hypothetical protein [Chloroflexota bacterium]